jgi:hypothetical protein
MLLIRITKETELISVSDIMHKPSSDMLEGVLPSGVATSKSSFVFHGNETDQGVMSCKNQTLI